MARRDHLIFAVVKPPERAVVQQAAKAMGLSLSAFVRAAAIDAAERVQREVDSRTASDAKR